MSADDLSFTKDYYQRLEEGIEELPVEERERLYRPCAVRCVKDTVLKEQQRQFQECQGDLDLQYTRYGNSEYFFANIIEKGRVYEIGYPKCLCRLAASGFVHSPVHCECSRQSILYILHNLLPNKEIRVKTIETVLGGGSRCRFRVVIESSDGSAVSR